MVMVIDFYAFLDEMDKIAEAKPAITKARLKKGLGIAGTVGAATGAGIATGRGLRYLFAAKGGKAKVLKEVAKRPGLVKALQKYGPYGLMAAGAGTAYLGRRMRNTINKEYQKA